MKKFTPNGAAIKQLRLGLERLSTQKEMANEIGVSIRMLRMIENENTSLPMTTIDRLAKALGVHRERLIYSTGSPVAVADTTSFAATVESILDDEDKLIPRHDWNYAKATMDEGLSYKAATGSHDMAFVVETMSHGT